jgi:hypothetical protein
MHFERCSIHFASELGRVADMSTGQAGRPSSGNTADLEAETFEPLARDIATVSEKHGDRGDLLLDATLLNVAATVRNWSSERMTLASFCLSQRVSRASLLLQIMARNNRSFRVFDRQWFHLKSSNGQRLAAAFTAIAVLEA